MAPPIIGRVATDSLTSQHGWSETRCNYSQRVSIVPRASCPAHRTSEGLLVSHVGSRSYGGRQSTKGAPFYYTGPCNGNPMNTICFSGNMLPYNICGTEAGAYITNSETSVYIFLSNEQRVNGIKVPVKLKAFIFILPSAFAAVERAAITHS